MSPYRFTRPPRALRKARVDNLALVPASLLPFRDIYQRLANGYPRGTTLIVLPTKESRPTRTLSAVAALLKAKGRHVSTVSATQFA
jgi:hypothetical protein